MVAISGHTIVNIGAENELLLATLPGDGHLDRDERCVVDSDPTALGRRYQPIGSLCIAPEHGAEQADERQAGDWRAAIEPGAVTRNAYVEMAAINGLAPFFGGRRRFFSEPLESL
jgi:hypothetical protein